MRVNYSYGLAFFVAKYRTLDVHHKKKYDGIVVENKAIKRP